MEIGSDSDDHSKTVVLLVRAGDENDSTAEADGLYHTYERGINGARKTV